MAATPDSAPKERRRRYAILASLWAAVVASLLAFRAAVLPFAFAALIAYLMAPLVDALSGLRLGRRRVPRAIAILLIYAVAFLAVYLLLLALLPQLYRELVHLSRFVTELSQRLTPERIQELALRAERWFAEHGMTVQLARRPPEPPGAPRPFHVTVDLEQLVTDAVQHVSGLFRENLGGLLTLSRTVVVSVVTTFLGLLFVLMVAAFFSIDSVKIAAYVMTLIPPDLTSPAEELFGRIDRSLSGIIRGQLTICVVNGALTFLGLALFKVRFALVLASVATVLAIIPIFGTILSSVPILLVALAQSWRASFGMLLWILGIHALEAYLLNPRIMGRAARIHPLAIAFALIAGERTLGLVGGLFALPVAAVLVACFDFARQKAQP